MCGCLLVAVVCALAGVAVFIVAVVICIIKQRKKGPETTGEQTKRSQTHIHWHRLNLTHAHTHAHTHAQIHTHSHSHYQSDCYFSHTQHKEFHIYIVLMKPSVYVYLSDLTFLYTSGGSRTNTESDTGTTAGVCHPSNILERDSLNISLQPITLFFSGSDI